MNAWIKENGRAPNISEGLSVLQFKTYPVRDGWGRPLIYKPDFLLKKQQFYLYSTGPNGIDDGGEDDDIRF
ncbi:hypothetical protein V8J88_01900 [Massilia sp. W12]|uniref:hypothetical protein n=1 Tax=Massilia sp. W12 TaxID=3126507 RepID=UPI0030CFC511